MLRKRRIITMILAASLFLAGAEGVAAGSITSINTVKAVSEDAPSSSTPEYDDLYGLRVEVTQNPTNPYYRSGTPDYSGLELSVFTKGKDGTESEVLSNASLDEVRTMFNVEAMEGPGGGVFVVMVSAYSTTLNRTVTANAEFYMEVIDSSEVTSIRSEIVNLPNDTVMYADTGLDLTGLTLSVWETTNDGAETGVYTNADLDTIRERYTVDVSYKASENDGEAICVITIYTSVMGMEIKTSSEFTYTVGGSKPTVKGDVNADGAFNVSDVVLLQKWLLAVTDTHLANWKAADFCEDERLDVFDLCLMKRELLNSSTEKEYPVKNPEVIDEFTPCTAELSDIQEPGKFYIIIRCQYSDPNRVWTIDDFEGIDNIKTVAQSYQENPYRTVLEIKLQDEVAEKMLLMVHSIEELGMEEIKEFQFINYATGLPE